MPAGRPRELYPAPQPPPSVVSSRGTPRRDRRRNLCLPDAALVTTSWVFVTFDPAGEVFQGPHNAQHYPPGAALSMWLSRSYPLSTKEYFRTLWSAAN